jgi:hypothetical protein
MRTLILAFTACAICFPSNGYGQELLTKPSATPAIKKPDDDSKENDEDKRKLGEIAASTVLEGIDNPFSITIEPESDRIFLAESGAQRIVEIKDGKILPTAADFAAVKYRGYDAGPLSVFCAAENVLLVGHDNAEGEGSLTLLKLKPNAEDPSKPEVTRETIKIEKKNSETKLGQFSNIMVKHSVIYVVTHGDEENGWIALAEFQNEKVKSFRPSIPTAKRSSYPGPTCSAVSPGGEYLVVSQMGKEGEAKDSRLVFYTLQGKMLRNFEVDLHDIVALAYSPNRQHLFAIDYNYADPSKGGLYKLIGKGAEKCEAKKLQDVSYATSMAFDSKGNLFIATLGGPPATDGEPTGKLIKIEGLDETPEDADDESAEEETQS